MNLPVFERARERLTQATSGDPDIYMYGRSVRDRPLSLMYRDDNFQLRDLLPKFKTKRQTMIASAIIADMIMSAQRDPGQRISYSRDKNWWRASKRYRDSDFTAETVVPVIDTLAAEGFMEIHDVTRRGDRGCRSSFLPAAFLRDIKAPAFQRRTGELIRLKDASKQLVDYRDTDKTEAERRFMRSVNEAISGYQLEIATPDAVRDGQLVRFAKSCVNLGHTELYRVFNGSWFKGGRMYAGWWQSVPGDQREPYMHIDGKPVVEEDYRQLHARMLYRLEGWLLPDEEDAYAIEGFDRDKVCKPAFHILINAPDFDSAKGAIMFKCGLTPDEAKSLIDAMKTKHVLIANHFHSGKGLSMQFLDAAMAKFVLREMVLRHDICCLPVHDSFLVPREHRDLLVEVMRRAYEETMSKATGRNVSRNLIK